MASRRLPTVAWFFVAAGLVLHAQAGAGSETLADAWRISASADRRVQAAHQLTDAAAHELAAAKGARLPAIDFDGGYTVLDHAPSLRVDLPPLTVPGLAAPLQIPFDRLPAGQVGSWTYTASATLPLFTSGRISEAVRSANAQLDAARADEAATTLDTRMRVAEAYVSVLRATRLRDVVDSEVNSLGAHAADAANLVAQGVAAKNDRLAAEVALADARERCIRADNALDSARAAYNRLLGRRLDYPVTLEEPPVPAVDGDLDALTARALTRRPELAALAGRADAQSHRAASLVASTRPQAAAGGGYSYKENQFQLYPGLWSAGLSVQWHLLDGGVARAEAAAARSQADAATSRLEDLRSTVALEVRQAWLDVDSAERRVQVTRDALAQADENVRVARDRYTAGLGIATEVLDAESFRVRAETSAASAAYDRILAILRLRRAVGDL